MIVAFDANILVYLFDENANAPTSKATGQQVERCRERVEYLIAMLQREKAKIIIPTPSLAESLVRAQDGAPERLSVIKRSRHFRISAFDERAAVEYAAMQIERQRTGKKFEAISRAKAKFDDQIMAIAAVEGAAIIYSDDGDIKKAAALKFDVLGIEDLPLPPESSQTSFNFRGDLAEEWDQEEND
ncbi:type II toxin-antitoxin system VapC family toxin [Rhizobium deserti]|uniref:Type II toxin-antitoxin system VapC family toxin n=1 Tax=Rhizobium deserti TaxID=2547961 RepID=A0A4R5UJJ0_9HYPH|nr:type II toxin-antitoxin system VapC family toxin [Rhizobium deserti]TDK37027.1 type II toxin-antitoxin system VapC family toxin [Rhizobium deserti]